MDSIKVRDFTATLENFINNYDLPAEVKRLALFEIYANVKAKADAELYQEAAERSKNKSTEKGEQ